MRTLKFRAWIISQKKMIKVFGFNEYLVFEQTWDSPSIKENVFEIEDCILMQFTGLKDKSGKEIYEGDIINGDTFSGKKLKCQVIYDENHGCYQLKSFKEKSLTFPIKSFLINLEVIGNIHENPELLSTPTAVL